jgi:hypothetical protein
MANREGLNSSPAAQFRCHDERRVAISVAFTDPKKTNPQSLSSRMSMVKGCNGHKIHENLFAAATIVMDNEGTLPMHCRIKPVGIETAPPNKSLERTRDR